MAKARLEETDRKAAKDAAESGEKPKAPVKPVSALWIFYLKDRIARPLRPCLTQPSLFFLKTGIPGVSFISFVPDWH